VITVPTGRAARPRRAPACDQPGDWRRRPGRPPWPSTLQGRPSGSGPAPAAWPGARRGGVPPLVSDPVRPRSAWSRPASPRSF